MELLSTLLKNFIIFKQIKRHNWYIDGKGHEPYPKEWNEIRKKILERDNYTCQKCGIKSKQEFFILMESHHIKEFNK